MLLRISASKNLKEYKNKKILKYCFLHLNEFPPCDGGINTPDAKVCNPLPSSWSLLLLLTSFARIQLFRNAAFTTAKFNS